MSDGKDEAPLEPDEQQAHQAAARTAGRAKEKEGPDDVVTLSNGVTMRVRAVSSFILRNPLRELPEPQPPVVHLEDKGVDEPNPADPEFIKAHAEWELTVGMSIMDTLLILGTTEPTDEGELRPLIVERPDTVLSPESDGWVKWLEAGRVAIDVSTPELRYLSWLRYYLLSTTRDLNALSAAIAQKSGVGEEDVALAAKSFQGDKARRPDTDVPDAPNRAHRRAIQRSGTRSGAGNRRT